MGYFLNLAMGWLENDKPTRVEARSITVGNEFGKHTTGVKLADGLAYYQSDDVMTPFRNPRTS